MLSVVKKTINNDCKCYKQKKTLCQLSVLSNKNSLIIMNMKKTTYKDVYRKCLEDSKFN